MTVIVDGTVALQVRRDRLQPLQEADATLEVDADSELSISIDRGEVGSHLRILLGRETLLATTGPDVTTARERWFSNALGECELLVEEETEAGTEGETLFVPLYRVLFQVRAKPEVERDYRVMLEELERVHLSLASDVLGRTRLQRNFTGATRPLHAPDLLRQLEAVEQRLATALSTIERQPSTALTRENAIGRWRAGDRADSRLVAGLARAGVFPPGTGRKSAGAPKLPALRVAHMALTTDIPEHRHLAEGLRALSNRAARVAERCRATASGYRAAEARWGARSGREGSVYEKRYLPRAQAMDELAARSARLAEAFSRLLDRSEFLANTGSPRTRFGPTPLFLNRPPYREAYTALRDASAALGILVDTRPVTTYLKSLATLYEYWCFLRVVEAVRARFGPAGDTEYPMAEVYDGIYRPELRAGQAVEFDGDDLGRITVRYEPDFLPWREALARGERFAASLTASPLRPDIVVEVSGRDGSTLLLFDAKSTDAFTMDHLRRIADYLILIHEPRTGRQPAKQLFLLHRDPQARAVCSLPGYLEGRADSSGVVKGAIPAIPAKVNAELPELQTVLDRFFETCTARQARRP